ncbi:MAG: prolyl oligopeptidase family serine peptidase [Thermomicrobiales bacterium]
MTSQRQPQPFGTWTSSVTIDSVIGGGLKLGELRVSGNAVTWSEMRAAEAGRTTVMQATGSDPAELTPAPFNVRSRVHEYGGGAWVGDTDLQIFSNVPDNRLYRRESTGTRPITPESAWRFADLVLDTSHNRLYAVREDHSLADTEAVNTIVLLDPEGPNDNGGQIIVSGTDFVSSLTLNESGDRVAWLSWNHPNMPWDGCDLHDANIDASGNLTGITIVAGGVEESIVQPRFLTDGRLAFVSDRSGWWNLHVADADGTVTPLITRSAEFGFPQWQFGRSVWDIVDEQTLIVSWSSEGISSVGTLDLASGELRTLDQPFTVVRSIRALPGQNAAVAIVASATESARLVRFDLANGSHSTIRGSTVDIDPTGFSIPESLSWPTPDGAIAHGFYYAATNTRFTGIEAELPPLIVESHGGPTGASDSAFSLSKQFWTSRGFAILDVNYGGSTGYGRAYRMRLNGRWGIVDVDDCISGVEALIQRGVVDPERIIIRGGSAGGYTTLVALTTSNVFRVGTSYYGVGDLETLATDTHKFESRYLDNLIGAYPEQKDLYIERSPIHHTDRLSAAMLLLQGLDDKVVPPNQSEAMARAVREKGLPVAHIEFAGEGHGFRGDAAQRRSLEAELSFYAQIFGFTPADSIEPIPIENLP